MAETLGLTAEICYTTCMTEPLKVEFIIETGDVWIDPEDQGWKAVVIGREKIYLERVVAIEVDPIELVRKWRKLGNDE